MIENGRQLRELNDTVTTTDSNEDQDLITSSDSDGEESHLRLMRRMNEVTHKDSFIMHDIQYYECCKAASLWLNDITVIVNH